MFDRTTGQPLLRELFVRTGTTTAQAQHRDDADLPDHRTERSTQP